MNILAPAGIELAYSGRMGDVGAGSTTAQRLHRRRWIAVAVAAALGLGVALFLVLRTAAGPDSTPPDESVATTPAWPAARRRGCPQGRR